MRSFNKTLVSAFAAILLPFVTIGHAETPATTQPIPANIDQLVSQLGSDSAKDRDAAQQKLADIGTAAEPQLKKAAADSDDPEIRSRAAAVLAQLKDRQDNQDASQASLITMHTDKMLPQDALNLIGEQAHAKLLVRGMAASLPNKPGRTVTIDVDQKPFWEVMRDVCGQLNICPDLGNQGSHFMRFTPSWDNWMAKSPYQVQGAYWVSVVGFQHTRTMGLTGGEALRDQFTGGLWVIPEPKLKVTHISDFVVKEAVDDAGNSLMPVARSSDMRRSSLRRMGQTGHTVDFSLTYPDVQAGVKAGTKIKILRGEMTLLVAQDFQTYQADDVLGTPKVTNPLQGGDIKLTVAPQGENFRVEIKCLRGTMAENQWSALMNYTGDMTLEDAKGNAYNVARPFTIHSMSDAEGNGNFTADALFTKESFISSITPSMQPVVAQPFAPPAIQLGGAAAAAVGNGRVAAAPAQPSTPLGDPQRLRWTFPGSFKSVNLPVTFRDLPMP
jgi:hypothetical protein